MSLFPGNLIRIGQAFLVGVAVVNMLGKTAEAKDIVFLIRKDL